MSGHGVAAARTRPADRAGRANRAGRADRAGRGQAGEQVVGHYGDGHVHHHEDRDRLGGLAPYRMYRSGSRRTSVTRMAMRKNIHRGADVIRVVTGQATHAMITPITVSFA